MNKYNSIPLIILHMVLFCMAVVPIATCKPTDTLNLWYNRPAADWNGALPIGNGHIGAMVFGGISNDRIQFNEETLWNGKPRDYNHAGASDYLPEIRQLLAEGKQDAAERLAGERFMGTLSEAGDKKAWFNAVRAYEAECGALHTMRYDDSQWSTMELPTHAGLEVAGIHGLEGFDGAIWFRVSFEVPADFVGRELVLDLGKIRDEDFTYLNGRLIGSSVGANEGRRYVLPPNTFRKGTNCLAIQVLNYYDKGGMVGYKDTATPLAIYPKGGVHGDGIPLPTEWRYFVQNEDAPSIARYQADYQPFADILLSVDGHERATSYRRELDISKALARTTYVVNGVQYTRTYFVSHPAKVLVVRVEADRKGQVDLHAGLRSPHRSAVTRRVDAQTLGLSLQVKNGALRGESLMRVVATRGNVEVTDEGIRVSGADDVTFYLSAATNFVSFDDVSGDPQARCNAVMARLAEKSYDAIKRAHVTDYRSYFDTFSMEFGDSNRLAVPTDQRIARFKDGGDPNLVALFAQYGRYLLISSSRPGSQPANLQGIWNELMTPPWGSKYTLNINAEMNYWPAELMGLSALHEPFFDMIDDLRERGQQTADIHYGAPGWVVHHNTDLWRGTAPINNPNHGIWQGAPAWLCQHLWERYRFTMDKAFLRNRAYPTMKAAAQFYLHTLVEDEATGYLISSPSNSPETGGLVAGPAMDHQLIRALFSNCIAAAEVLGIDNDFINQLRGTRAKVAPDFIGKYGQLQEWVADIDDPNNKHRHVSHLWAVYPGEEINWDGTPALMSAARRSLEFRGDEGTGWSLAWKINWWARMRDAGKTVKLLSMLLSPANEGGGVYPNLLDAHPPFQIDGNFGGAAGIVEALVQSHGDYIDILPMRLDLLPDGYVKGIRARGGFVVDIRWRNHRMEELLIHSLAGQPLNIRHAGNIRQLPTEKGSRYRFGGHLQHIE